MRTNSQLISWAHKIVTAGILATGTFFNVCALFFGMDLVARTFFTLSGELVLTAWFFSAFILGVAAELKVPLANRPSRIVRRIVTIYMFMLTMMHGVNNILLDNVAFYTKVFSGPFYMYPALLVLGGLTIFTASLPVPGERNAVSA
jgi:hypothetical protein